MEARSPTNAPRRLLLRLLAGTIAPTVAALALFGFFAHEVARRALEDELGRRLGTAAAGAAATLLPEQLRAFGAGDEDSLTYAGVRRRLEAARLRLRVRRVLAVTPDLEARGDTSSVLALGAHAYELDADRAEIARALGGVPSASPLFVGHDGVPYKRAYAAVGDAGDVAGVVAVEGNADYPAVLAAFRRSLIRTGVGALLAVLALTIWLSRRISRPVARLAQAAARLGRGDLDVPIPIETRDEIGVLAQTLEETRAALRARDERMQMMLAGIAHEVRNPLGGLELYAGLLRDALANQPERLDEIARIDREVGHLKAVVNEFLEFARRPSPRLEAVPLGPLFDEVRELASVHGGAAVATDAVDGLAVRADALQLRRALLNLARNAVAAARAG
ncbi:MAG TPA: HAMP domain-containing sensor histidine kinase, partial [Polyangia bacterium]|nr:HAMP domain-containing sensor histidine kinase [Polyangia bacterium]